MKSNDKLAESMRALADAWRQSDSPIAQVHAALLDGALAAAPAPSEPAEAVGTLTVRRYRGSDAMVNHDFDLHATLPDGSYQLYLRQTEPAPAPSEPDEAVGYLDIGAGGYIDIGSDLTDAQLSAMPKGRHMLGIIGTYGVDAAVERDAARYRFLRKKIGFSGNGDGTATMHAINLPDSDCFPRRFGIEEQIDHTIDAAIDAQQQENKQ